MPGVMMVHPRRMSGHLVCGRALEKSTRYSSPLPWLARQSPREVYQSKRFGPRFHSWHLSLIILQIPAQGMRACTRTACVRACVRAHENTLFDHSRTHSLFNGSRTTSMESTDSHYSNYHTPKEHLSPLLLLKRSTPISPLSPLPSPLSLSPSTLPSNPPPPPFRTAPYVLALEPGTQGNIMV